jgi:two-component system OmpR family response regulator
VSAFHADGDDFLTKPLALAELIARVRALLERSETSSAPTSGLRPDTGRHG